MVLEFGPQAPLILHLLAAAALVLHIGGGSIAMLAGALAMFVRKGGRLHRQAGTVFFVAMMTMASIAAIVAPILAEPLEDRWTNTTAAIFTLYLTASARMTVRRPAGTVGRFERWAIIVPLGITAMALGLGIANMSFVTVFAFGAVSALAAVCDARIIYAGGLAGVARVSRHVWRMSAALFVAAGSFFFGQADVLPDALRATILPNVLGLAPLILLAFWMVRVRLGRFSAIPKSQ